MMPLTEPCLGVVLLARLLLWWFRELVQVDDGALVFLLAVGDEGTARAVTLQDLHESFSRETLVLQIEEQLVAISGRDVLQLLFRHLPRPAHPHFRGAQADLVLGPVLHRLNLDVDRLVLLHNQLNVGLVQGEPER